MTPIQGALEEEDLDTALWCLPPITWPFPTDSGSVCCLPHPASAGSATHSR